MNSKVRDFIKREVTSYGIQIADFNRVYHIFEQIVEADINERAVEGLRERLPYALTKISMGKIDRNDVVTFFPIIWGKFEAYVKKLVLLADVSKYNLLMANPESSLPDYLNALGIVINLPQDKRTKESKTVYYTYRLRNTEAHECELWGLRTFYDRLAQTLSAYLIVTKDAIKKMDASQTDHICSCGISLDYSQTVICVNPDDNDFNRFFRVKDFNIRFKRISRADGLVKEFDDEGRLIRSVIDTDQFTTEACYEYEFNSFHILKQHCYSILSGKESPSMPAYQEKEHSYSEYKYDDDGGIVSIVHYEHEKRHDANSQYYKQKSLHIDYHPDGSISIHQIRYKPLNRVSTSSIQEGYFQRDPNDQDVVIDREMHYEYDNRGLLQTVRDKGNNVTEKYEYDEAGDIIRIVFRAGNERTVERLGTARELLFYETTRTDSERYLSQKMSFDDDRVYRIVTFPKEAARNGDFSTYGEIQFETPTS